MKRIVFLTLAIILIISLLLVGCKKEEATTTPPKTTPPTTAVTTTPPVDARLANIGALAKPEGGKEGGRLQLQAGVNINNIGDPTGTAGPRDAAFSFPGAEPLAIIDKKNNLS